MIAGRDSGIQQRFRYCPLRTDLELEDDATFSAKLRISRAGVEEQWTLTLSIPKTVGSAEGSLLRKNEAEVEILRS